MNLCAVLSVFAWTVSNALMMGLALYAASTTAPDEPTCAMRARLLLVAVAVLYWVTDAFGWFVLLCVKPPPESPVLPASHAVRLTCFGAAGVMALGGVVPCGGPVLGVGIVYGVFGIGRAAFAAWLLYQPTTTAVYANV